MPLKPSYKSYITRAIFSGVNVLAYVTCTKPILIRYSLVERVKTYYLSKSCKIYKCIASKIK